MEISFIICSYRPELLEKCQRSVAASLVNACRYEFIVTSGDKKRGIFGAYDKAAKKANFPLLCFLHEDVEILSHSYWLQHLQPLLQLKETGIVGVAGSKDFTSTGIWWDQANRLSGAALHSHNSHQWVTSYGEFGEVIVVDGLIFFIKKEVFDGLGGYSKTDLDGYHYYDVDLCMRAHWAGYRNYTINLMVQHASIGQMPPQWEINRRKWLAKYLSRLPARL